MYDHLHIKRIVTAALVFKGLTYGFCFQWIPHSRASPYAELSTVIIQDYGRATDHVIQRTSLVSCLTQPFDMFP